MEKFQQKIVLEEPISANEQAEVFENANSKPRHSSKKFERFEYRNRPESEAAREHLEREKLLKNRREEEIEKGYFDPNDDFVVDSNDYKILSKQMSDGAGARMGIDLVASKYLKHGIDLADKVSQYDMVIYLDKSARPLDALARKTLKTVFPDRKRPDSRFLNIDRQDIFSEIGIDLRNGWINDGKKSELARGTHFINEFIHLSQGEQDRILAAVRSQFLDKSAEIDFSKDNQDVVRQILDAKTVVEGKKVVAVDETSFSGATLSVSGFLLKRALPEAQVDESGIVFWDSDDKVAKDKHGNITHGTIPVWYDKDNDFGRGIGDRNSFYHNSRFEKSPTRQNFLRKIGSAVLSAPHVDVEGNYLRDEDFEDLMFDFDQLLLDFRDNKVFVEPPLRGDVDLFCDLMEAQAASKGLEFQDMLKIRNARRENGEKIAVFETFEKPI
ncbi:MAG: hypothetical protein Q4A27_00245 [bacterium]|nr:hypothetical protein [bacterium]